MLTLESLGWRPRHQVWFSQSPHAALAPARVAAVHHGSLTLLGLHPADVLRPERVPAPAPREGPLSAATVGDWVACRGGPSGFSVDAVLPRETCFVRKAKGRASGAQLVAANVDRVLVVTAPGGDLSARRLERYLTQVWASGAEPVIVVNKIDRPHDAEALHELLASVAAGVLVVEVSALTGAGLATLAPLLAPGTTVALVGSSGVGKSSLCNRLLGEARFDARAVRTHDDTGTHTTTHRELVRAPDGFLLIDTPGMRELGLLDAESGLDAAFPELAQLAEGCRFRDCQHGREPGCALREAVARGQLPAARLASYLRLADELADHGARARERASADARRHDRSIHKLARARRKLHGRLGLKDD